MAGYTLIGFPDGTRLAIYNDLTAAGLPFDFEGSQSPPDSTVPDNQCSAVAGHRIWQQRSQVESDLAAYKPNLVVWLCGANDFGIEGIVAADLVADIEDMIVDAAVLYPNLAWVLCLETLQTSAPSEVIRAQFNTQLRTMVTGRAAQGYNVMIGETDVITLADLTDNVHFTAGGYLVVGGIQATAAVSASRNFPGSVS